MASHQPKTKMDLFLFGDQTASQGPLLRRLAARKDNGILTTFIQRAISLLKDEIRILPRSRRNLMPDFLSLSHLVEWYFTGDIRVSELDSSLTTIAQLGHFIGHFEDASLDYPMASEFRAVGLCTGLLAATAISAARSLSELVPIALEAVKLSFRIGTLVGKAKESLAGVDSHECWSTIVTGVSERDIQEWLDRFHSTRKTEHSSRAYLSALSAAAVTVSGPPSTTDRFFESCEEVQTKERIPLPIFSPYHAGHLFSEADVDALFNDTSRDVLQQFRSSGLLHDGTTGMARQPCDAYEALHITANEILRRPVDWTNLLDTAVSEITPYTSGQTAAMAVGVANIANSLIAAMAAAGHHNVRIVEHTAWDCNNMTDRSRTQNDKIAIVGMAGRFPNSANHEALWDLLMKGLDVHKEIPSDRFDAQAHCDPSGKGRNKSHTPYGCFIDEPGLFDPRFFNMSPREAAQTDPMGRLALTTAYEALEMSGYVPNRTPSSRLHRIGTFYGQTSDDWREINAAENVDTYFITGGVRAFAPGRINYYFKFSGPSFSVDTACSSSLSAIQLACTSLWAGDLDTACAGGLNVLTSPDIFSGLSKGQFLSKTGSCKTYDNDADGYCRGDGVGTVILKRYQDALADNDNILGCILGAGTNHSAEAVSITHPHAGAQEFLYKKVLADAGVDAHDVSYVEMHGTGTQAGDGIEMTSVTNTFAPRHRQRRLDQPLYLGAVKANIGHGEAASGINSLIKVMLMLRESQIPPNVGIKGVINKSFPADLGIRNVHIPVSTVALPRSGEKKRKVFLNNFSAAGGNTALLIEDGPLPTAPTSQDIRSHHIITVSARSISSLKKNINNLVGYLDRHPNTSLPSLSYTTTARRIQHNYRIAFAADQSTKIRQSLASQIKASYSPVAMAGTSVAFVFTGQGSQYTGLGQQLYRESKVFRTEMDQLDSVVHRQGFPSILPLLMGSDPTTLSPVIVQLGMSCIQIALAKMWSSWGIKPVAIVGHSLGEYAALQVAGVLSASDMIRLVGHRAQLLVDKCTEYSHGMLAVRADEGSIAEALGSAITEIACRNAPEETVLCGPTARMTEANQILTSKGFKSTMLKVPFAFHSEQIDAITEHFTEVSSSVNYMKPTVPILSPLLRSVIRESDEIAPDYLPRHARETVDFCAAITVGYEEGVCTERTAWLEIGAHPICSSMIKSTTVSSPLTAASLRRNEDVWKTLTTSICALYLAGVNIDFDEYHREYNDAHELLTLPTYSFDDKNYWLEYHNNWCLTKGQDLGPAKVELIAEVPAKLSTTSCQKIVHESFDDKIGSVTVQSDLAESKLFAAVCGHLVNDTPLCPSSLYADMALTIMKYVCDQMRPDHKDVGFNVCNMEVPKPLIAKMPPPPEGQHIQLEAIADFGIGQANLKWRSVTPDGKLLQEHARCVVKFESTTDWQESWDMAKYMVQSQIDILKQKVATGGAHSILRGMAYKLFKALVNYDEKYRGMQEVIINGKDTEATASIKFQTKPEDGNFVCAPYWIDSLCHISGFICNGTDLIDSEQNVFISHGWGSMKFARAFSADKTYRSYVRMQARPNNVRSGDVYIFEDDDIVGVVGGLKFQQIPRRVLDAMLPPSKARPAVAAPPKVTAVAASGRPTASRTTSLALASTKGTAKALKSLDRNTAKSSIKKSKQRKPAAAFSGTVVATVMSIIAKETDVEMAELVDDAAFENLGVDSLLSLTISAKFREDLELEIPSNLFTNHTTVGALKKYFAVFDGGAPLPDPNSSDEESSYEEDDATPATGSSRTSLPSTPSEMSEREDKLAMPIATPIGAIPASADGHSSVPRLIFAQEMGLPAGEINDKADLSEMGMDSLMSLTVLSRLREELGQDLPSTFLITNPTLMDVEEALGMRSKPVLPTKPAIKSHLIRPSAGARTTTGALQAVSAKLEVAKQAVIPIPDASSFILQGNAKTATKRFFLLPDGSGSATSYSRIPKLSNDYVVFGLNCPFMTKPEDFTMGVEAVAKVYIKEIKRRQPVGPYLLGGWSAGGVIAYEVCLQFLAQGDEVEHLVLIDSPSPQMASEKLPPGLHVFFNDIGLLGNGTAIPPWLLDHFAATIRALSQYVARPMPAGKAPKTFAIWCRRGVCGDPGDPRPPVPADGEPSPMKFLLNHRTDFGDIGWSELLGPVQTGVMDGNHFTMMQDEHAEALGALIRQGLGIKA